MLVSLAASRWFRFDESTDRDTLQMQVYRQLCRKTATFKLCFGDRESRVLPVCIELRGGGFQVEIDMRRFGYLFRGRGVEAILLDGSVLLRKYDPPPTNRQSAAAARNRRMSKAAPGHQSHHDGFREILV